MKLEELFLEMAAPTAELIKKVFYHGTSSEAAALGILKSGIEPGDLAEPEKYKGLKSLVPVPGKVYITPDLRYAQMYAIGGDYAGRELDLDGPDFGYLFAIKGSDLVDVQPDEDSVGEMVWREFRKPGKDQLIRRVADLVTSVLTSSQLKKLKNGEYAMYAHAGKKVMSELSDDEKIGLIAAGAHVAHHGKLMPTAAWLIDLYHVKDLKRDGSNFFDYAEKIK
jgi:hypothetical protein